MNIEKNHDNWLILFYSIPARPVSKRMKIWRRLVKSGALHFKGSVYLLPFNDDNFEFCQWLIAEINDMGGEAAFVVAANIETITNDEIKRLFNLQRDKDYRIIAKRLEEMEIRIQSIKNGTESYDMKKLFNHWVKLIHEFEEIRKADFFNSEAGGFLSAKIESTSAEIKGLKVPLAKKQKPLEISTRNIEAYQRKTWITRKKPFVDRMASAWLIKKFIDKDAVFDFIDEKEIASVDANIITFDIHGGTFTHLGDLCTFEVLLKSFGLKNRALQKIAEIVHELDIKDKKFRVPETKLIEDILIGIRKTAQNDAEALQKGIDVFEMLYAGNI